MSDRLCRCMAEAQRSLQRVSQELAALREDSVYLMELELRMRRGKLGRAVCARDPESVNCRMCVNFRSAKLL